MKRKSDKDARPTRKSIACYLKKNVEEVKQAWKMWSPNCFGVAGMMDQSAQLSIPGFMADILPG